MFSLCFESVHEEKNRGGKKHESQSIEQYTHRGSNPIKRELKNKLEKERFDGARRLY